MSTTFESKDPQVQDRLSDIQQSLYSHIPVIEETWRVEYRADIGSGAWSVRQFNGGAWIEVALCFERSIADLVAQTLRARDQREEMRREGTTLRRMGEAEIERAKLINHCLHVIGGAKW